MTHKRNEEQTNIRNEFFRAEKVIVYITQDERDLKHSVKSIFTDMNLNQVVMNRDTKSMFNRINDEIWPIENLKEGISFF